MNETNKKEKNVSYRWDELCVTIRNVGLIKNSAKFIEIIGI